MNKINELLSKIISKLNASVKTEAQSFSEEEKAQVRQNIGAMSVDVDIPSTDVFATKNDVVNNNYVVFNAYSEDGANYTGTVEGLTEYKNGQILVMILKTQPTSGSITLDINGLGTKYIYRMRKTGIANVGTAVLDSGKSYIIKMYNSSFWTLVELPKPDASDLYGSVPIGSGGHGGTTAEEARANLGITPENIGAAKTDHTHIANITETQLTELSTLLEGV